MSFSAQIKNVLARTYPDKQCCQLAELSAILRMEGTFHIQSKDSYAIHTSSESAAVARKIYKLLTDLFGLRAEVVVRRRVVLKGGYEYIIYIPPQPSLNQVFNEVGILDDQMRFTYTISPWLIKKNCCAVSYLRGAFMGGGAINDPRKGYHFELVTDKAEYVSDLQKLMNRFDLNAKVNARKKNYAVYLKESDKIIQFLAYVGAHSVLFQWEDIKIIKEMRNKVNRLVNCDTANSNRTVQAASKQLKDISEIDHARGINTLPANLKAVAVARLKYPEVNIRELGQLLEPPIGKSAVNHRLRKINQIAKGFRSLKSNIYNNERKIAKGGITI